MSTINILHIGTDEFVSYEAPNYHSRDQGVLAGPLTAIYPSGTVLGKITSSGLYTALNPAATDGSQNFAAFLSHARGPNSDTLRAPLLTRAMDFNLNKITFINALTTQQLATFIAQAAAQGCIARG